MQQDKEDNKEIAEIEDAIPANVNDILQELPEDKRNAVLATMMSIEEERTFSGPLPPPVDTPSILETEHSRSGVT